MAAFDEFARRRHDKRYGPMDPGLRGSSHLRGTAAYPCARSGRDRAAAGRAGLIASGILAFVVRWNEFSVALNLTSRDAATVPVAIARFAQL